MFRKSLVGILASFQKAIDDLDELQKANTKQVSENDTKVQILTQESVQLNEESDKAAAVRAKIADLIEA